MRLFGRQLACLMVALLACLPAFAQNQDKPALPRVLIIGDAVYNQYAREVPNELRGKVEIVFARVSNEEVLNSSTILANLDLLLTYLDRDGNLLPGDKRPKWDLIHFNVGLGDLIYRAPNMKSFRVMPIHAGGVRNTSAKLYGENLEELVKRLEQTGARLVWASTTPIRASSSDIFEVGSEIEYNQIAERVMKKHGVAINEMHGFAKSRMDMDKPAAHGADPFFFDKAPIHEPITDAIARELKIDFKRPAKEE